MSLTGWIYFGIFIFIIYLIVRKITNSSNPNEGTYKNKTLIRLKKGVARDLEVNYNDPNKTIDHDENTGEPYVNRKRGFMDKGDLKIPLTKDNYVVFEYPGWTLVLDEIDTISKVVAQKLIDNERKIIDMYNLLGLKDERIIELETKMEDIMNEKIKQHKDMKDAAMVIIKDRVKR